VSANLKWGDKDRKNVVVSDGKGYYAYLPAALIYHNLNLGFFDSIEGKYFDENTRYEYRSGAYGKTIDKYFAGVAVMQLPFFLAGHAITLMSNEAPDGYSKWYIICTCLGALFWLGVGLYYLRKLLRLHGASDGLSAFVLYTIFFGTNLYHYSVIEPCMSHLYSFSLVSMFLYFGKVWIDGGQKKYGFIAALLFGMIFLVRPVNVLAGLWLIYEARGMQVLKARKLEFLRKPTLTLLVLILMILPFTVQLAIWKIQTGHWFVNSYGDEAFHFLQPHVIDFLFSYKKGLFVYLPLTLIALLGIIPLWKSDRKRSVIAMLFFALIIYILSSWWQWYYGGSFGTRVVIEFLPMLSILLLVFLRSLHTTQSKIAAYTCIIALTLFCQFQTIQYRYMLIHWSEMTYEKYWDVFGKIP